MVGLYTLYKWSLSAEDFVVKDNRLYEVHTLTSFEEEVVFKGCPNCGSLK